MLIIEQLEQLENRLQGRGQLTTLRAAVDLWNRSEKRKPKRMVNHPMNEDHLSNYIVRFLQDNFHPQQIILGREVHVLNDERADIVVQARATDNPDNILSVAIEVKGSWYEDTLETAMEEQLLKQYMIPNYRCGIYLVGWFKCESWNKSDDSRRNKNPEYDFDEAKIHFATQAKALSQPGRQIRAFVLDARLPDSNH